MSKDQFALWERPVDPSDIVYTPVSVAKQIVDFLNPEGLLLDPCRGDGAFFNNFPQQGGGYVLRDSRRERLL